jgi:hypothetical protein
MACGQFRVFGEDTGNLLTQGDDAGAGEGCQIDQGVRLILFDRPGHGVDENQPPFGVGVADFNGLARIGTDDIPRADGRSPMACFPPEA